MKIAFQHTDLAELARYVPTILVLGAETKNTLGDWDLAFLDSFFHGTNATQVVDDAVAAGALNLEKASSYHHIDIRNGAAASDLVIIMFPDGDTDTLKAAVELNGLISSAAKKLLTKHQEIAVFNTTKFVLEVSAPTAVRAIQDAVYDYKDSLKDSAPKVVHYHSSEFLPLTNQERLDVRLHESRVFTRDLVTAPPNYVTPQTLVESAKAIPTKKNGIKVKTLDPFKEEMNGLTAVARGSSLPAEFIELTHMKRPNDKIDYVFIGKGITFDSGGYSLKPSKSMETMKGDMAGAATILGLFHYLAAHGSALNIVGLIPTCENMIGKDAIVPGEVITYSNGKTVEVLNTDAEGRLILADALIHSQKYEGAMVIDIATLTGGIVAGLGTFRSGLFTDDANLQARIEDAAQFTADHVWHMPMDEAVYKPKSEVADLPNITSGPSSITAAMFLKAFAPERWAHLDIAGTSGEAVGTGRPLPLIASLV